MSFSWSFIAFVVAATTVAFEHFVLLARFRRIFSVCVILCGQTETEGTSQLHHFIYLSMAYLDVYIIRSCHVSARLCMCDNSETAKISCID